MYSRNDPRVRRTLNQLSQNVASANETAQAGLFSFTRNFIDPCLSSLGGCIRPCTEPCFPTREDRSRRTRARPRGRAELNFDFYDDWEEDENTGLLGWGDDDGLDGLLSGSDAHRSAQQPGRQRSMSYGTGRGEGRVAGAHRKSAVQPYDGGPDPTVIPRSSAFGFLERLPWKIAGRGLRYKPSAADLQERPKAGKRRVTRRADPLVEEEEGGDNGQRGQGRKRSSTGASGASGQTTESLSSRGDIFPSEDELDDAVPLDDEFAMVLERRTTNSAQDESSSGRTRSTRRPPDSRNSTRTSSRSIQSTSKRKTDRNTPPLDRTDSGMSEVPNMADLRRQEQTVKEEEETDIERKRDAAHRLALERGLSAGEPHEVHPQISDTRRMELVITGQQPNLPPSEAEEQPPSPFPEFSSAAAAAQEAETPLDPQSPGTEDFAPANIPAIAQSKSPT